MRQIMQDGPPGAGYVLTEGYCGRGIDPIPRPVLRDDCRLYYLDAYTIDESMAYMDPRHVKRLLQVTCQKIASAAKQLLAGEGGRFQYMRDCCYCEGP
jgi:hypothetical protein